MKAEELMIGDWVSYKGNPIMVFEIDEPEHNINTEQDGYNAIRCISIDEIQPISLTPKILLKNGFKKNETHISTDFDLVMDGVDIFIIIFDDGDIVVDIEKNIVDGVNRLHHCEIKYVHQLQQAMRLCGITKEIKI